MFGQARHRGGLDVGGEAGLDADAVLGQIGHQGRILNRFDTVANTFGTQLANGLPHALGAGCFTGVHGDAHACIAHLAEVVDKEFSREAQLVTGQIDGDQLVAMGQTGGQLLIALLGAEGAAHDADQVGLDAEVTAARGHAVDDGFHHTLRVQLMGHRHIGRAEAQLCIVDTGAQQVFYVLVGNPAAGVVVGQHGNTPVQLLQEGDQTWLVLDDLYVGAQRLQLEGGQLNIVLATQLEDGLRTDVAVQMAVQVGQGERSVNHDGAFFESGLKACHSRRGFQKRYPVCWQTGSYWSVIYQGVMGIVFPRDSGEIEFLQLAGEGVATPTKQARRLLLVAVGVLQRRLQHDPFELGHGIGQYVSLSQRQLAGYPLLQLLLPATGQRRLAGLGVVGDGGKQLGGKIAHQHLLPGGHHGEPAADVLQLAHVARPGQAADIGLGIRVQALGLHVQLFGGAQQEVTGQLGNILTALLEGGNMNADDVEAVKQILAKLAIGDPLLQILVGGCDDPYIHLHRLVATYPVELAIGQDPQQPGLHIQRHVADLVEKQGAAVGLLEAAVADVVGAGEGPLLVTEQLGFDEIFRDSRHVEGNKVFVGARAVLVQGMGDQLLAGAALAVDQHRDAGA